MRDRLLLALAVVLSGCAWPGAHPAAEPHGEVVPVPADGLWPPQDGLVAGVGAGGTDCPVSPCTLRDAGAPGLTMDASLKAVGPDGRLHVLDATARNGGSRSVWPSSACVYDPWSETVLDARGMDLDLRRPAAPTPSSDDCNACDVRELAPGEALPFHSEFNETFWHPTAGPVPSRPGTYDWMVGLLVWVDAGCAGEPGMATLHFTVDVAPR